MTRVGSASAFLSGYNPSMPRAVVNQSIYFTLKKIHLKGYCHMDMEIVRMYNTGYKQYD